MKFLVLKIFDAQGNPIPIQGAGGMPQGGADSLNSIIGTGLQLAILAAVIVCLFMLILGGFEYIFSQGDKQKVAQARQRLVFSIIGLIVVFTSFVLINIIYTFFFGGAINFLGGK